MAISLTWPLTSDGAGAVTYTANDWRTLLTNLYGEGILGSSSFEVTERAAGANMNLDIAAGVAILTGDDTAGQGNYLVEATASTDAVTIGTADGSNPRIDLVGIQLRDPSEGGASGRDSIFSVVAGTAAASPSAPATPDSFLTLASVLVPASATSITDSDITDLRPAARLVHEVVNNAAMADAAVGAAELSSDAVTTSKIIDDAVTIAKLDDSSTGGTLASSSIRYWKVAGFVYVHGDQTATGTTIATLPTGFRPASELEFPAVRVGSSKAVEAVTVKTTGVIDISSGGEGGASWVAMFPAA